MKRFVTIGLFVLLLGLATGAQPFSLTRPALRIPGSFVSFSVDNLQNIYLLSATNQLRKLAPNGDSVAVYNDVKKFGEATLVDVSNPLKIVLFYRGFSSIVMLDGMLHVKNVIDLRKKNMFSVRAIGLSYDGRLWLYDEMDNSLKKIDDQGNLLFKTPDFRQLFDEAPVPEKIFDQNQYVYLYDPKRGIYVFDYYGAFRNKIPVVGWQNLSVSDAYVFGTDASFFYRYEPLTFKSQQWPLPPVFKKYTQILRGAQYLYALDKDGLDVFRLTN